VTLTFKVDLKIKQHAKYPGQRLFRTHTLTHWTDITLPGPLK